MNAVSLRLLSWIAMRLAVVAVLLPLPVAAEGYWTGVVSAIGRNLDDASRLSAAGQGGEARDQIEAAYFDIFEESRMEVAERLHLGMNRVTAVEDLFHKAEDVSDQPKKLAAALTDLRKALKADAAKLEAAHVMPDRESAYSAKVTPKVTP